MPDDKDKPNSDLEPIVLSGEDGGADKGPDEASGAAPKAAADLKGPAKKGGLTDEEWYEQDSAGEQPEYTSLRKKSPFMLVFAFVLVVALIAAGVYCYKAYYGSSEEPAGPPLSLPGQVTDAEYAAPEGADAAAAGDAASEDDAVSAGEAAESSETFEGVEATGAAEAAAAPDGAEAQASDGGAPAAAGEAGPQDGYSFTPDPAAALQADEAAALSEALEGAEDTVLPLESLAEGGALPPADSPAGAAASPDSSAAPAEGGAPAAAAEPASGSPAEAAPAASAAALPLAAAPAAGQPDAGGAPEVAPPDVKTPQATLAPESHPAAVRPAASAPAAASETLAADPPPQAGAGSAGPEVGGAPQSQLQTTLKPDAQSAPPSVTASGAAAAPAATVPPARSQTQPAASGAKPADDQLSDLWVVSMYSSQAEGDARAAFQKLQSFKPEGTLYMAKFTDKAGNLIHRVRLGFFKERAQADSAGKELAGKAKTPADFWSSKPTVAEVTEVQGADSK